MTMKHKRGPLGTGHVVFLDLGAGDMGVFSL